MLSELQPAAFFLRLRNPKSHPLLPAEITKSSSEGLMPSTTPQPNVLFTLLEAHSVASSWVFHNKLRFVASWRWCAVGGECRRGDAAANTPGSVVSGSLGPTIWREKRWVTWWRNIQKISQWGWAESSLFLPQAFRRHRSRQGKVFRLASAQLSFPAHGFNVAPKILLKVIYNASLNRWR